MSKYFKFNQTFQLKYPEDVATIRKYLENKGQVDCTDKELEDLWYEFSETWSAGWLNPCDGDDGTLAPFADWLAEYDEDRDYSEDNEDEDDDDEDIGTSYAEYSSEPCWMREHCIYRDAACLCSQPEDDGCYVYRRFRDIFKKQGLLLEEGGKESMKNQAKDKPLKQQVREKSDGPFFGCSGK